MLPANDPNLIGKSAFAVSVAIQSADGSNRKVLPCIWERGEVSMDTDELSGGESITHNTERLQATFAVNLVDIYGEGDAIVRNGKTHTILDAISDDGQTTFTLTK
tara:strand:+ start:120 stop:434 length:315 start_codon:yes stop_codon:yes gene_type:complete